MAPLQCLVTVTLKMRTEHPRSNLVKLSILLAALLLAPCGCKKQTQSLSSNSETGIASWYGKPFDGRPTASGEIFDMQKLTAAHRTLALGTVAEVQSLVNGKRVQVRINDRGPFVKDRIIDLSQAAAKTIDMPGVANVSLRVISSPVTRDLAIYAVQVGSFSTRESAEALRSTAASKYGSASVVFRARDQTWRVLVGEADSIESGNSLAKRVESELGDGYVVRVDTDH
jgi:rare lipoprotein A